LKENFKGTQTKNLYIYRNKNIFNPKKNFGYVQGLINTPALRHQSFLAMSRRMSS